MEYFPIVTDPALALFSPLVSEESVIPMMPMAEPNMFIPETEIEEIDAVVNPIIES